MGHDIYDPSATNPTDTPVQTRNTQMTARWYSSSDYAGLEGGDMSFYYGYEQTNDAGDWLFVARKKGKVVMQYTAKDLGEKSQWEVTDVLLAGIAKYFELAQL